MSASFFNLVTGCQKGIVECQFLSGMNDNFCPSFSGLTRESTPLCPPLARGELKGGNETIKEAVYMSFKKSTIYALMLCFAFTFVMFSKGAGCEETHWKFMGKTKDKNFLIYYDTASVKYIRKDYVSLNIKKERSKEGIEQFKKDFYSSVKEAEDTADSKIKGPVEPLLKALLERETKEYMVYVDCAENKIRVPPAERRTFNFVIAYDIDPGTPAERIRNEVCPSH